MIKIKRIIPAGFLRFWRKRWQNKLILLVIVAGCVAGNSIVITSQPGFCDSCHIMNSYYASWKTSAHADVSCLDCHLQPGFVGYVKGKINGLAQAVDCAVDRIGTKPNAKVLNSSCLRSECHRTEELRESSLLFNGVKFTHDQHMEKTIDGIEITCGSCHSHFEGENHFEVNKDVCFTCHFLSNPATDQAVVKTNCQGCHEVPDKVISRGLVNINHAEFVSYNASCEDSCHKKQIEKKSEVSENVCLNCHNYTKQHLPDGLALHEKHSDGEKVECFACHGKVSHEKSPYTSVATMMDCQSCHSDTHSIQANIYAAEAPAGHTADDRILSPMFLTHVACTGCHIEPTPVESATVGSMGTVAKAVPQACDQCHEPGTGDQYIPFWQKQIRQLHDQVRSNFARMQDRLRAQDHADAGEPLPEPLRQAQTLIQAVESDGSWGVHNLKYTEAMLLKANELINQDHKDLSVISSKRP